MDQIVVPRLFIPDVIKEVVLSNRPGVYVLGDNENGFVYRYVGRSDTCIRTRLLTHNYLYKYEYFIFRYVDNPKEAYYYESKWWHDCANMGINNKIHPDAPSGSRLVCPYCSFANNINRSFKFHI
ncbi:hypothetical protein [Clostridium sp.]|uniref:hypothetical protein n=1 Tax=Clostridium sp. TaxID=1506 RepID=UPI0028FE09A6|nr:hypothetical protein [Clostridium sp.]MDU2106215.1 hypothetical protein [Clostridium sp.]MDU3355254.1 hypothetical protein [Clostridium sp.]